VIEEIAVNVKRPRRIDSPEIAELGAHMTDRLRKEMASHGA
jgi:NitT/TauT family transport system ATP-binding protein